MGSPSDDTIRAILRALPDEHGCADLFAKSVWPRGFHCQACGHDHGYRLGERPRVWECAACGRQCSVTAGTALHGSKVPLRIWLCAAICMTKPGGTSANAFARALGLRYETVWRLLHRIRACLGPSLFGFRGAPVELARSALAMRPDGMERSPRSTCGVVAATTAGEVGRVAIMRAGNPVLRLLRGQQRPHEGPSAVAVLGGLEALVYGTYDTVGHRWLPTYLFEHAWRADRPDVRARLGSALGRLALSGPRTWRDLVSWADVECFPYQRPLPHELPGWLAPPGIPGARPGPPWLRQVVDRPTGARSPRGRPPRPPCSPPRASGGRARC